MISIIIPIHNEEGNIATLLKELHSVLSKKECEIICIDDGSTDASKKTIETLKIHYPDVQLIAYSRRRGKGYALNKGIDQARGHIIIFMDADLQDDPADITLFLAKIDAGYDVVNGWRQARQDKKSMTIISHIGNKLLWRGLLHSHLHDVNCGFKAIRKEALQDIPLYGDNFRFLPLLAQQEGFRVSEVVVHNRARLSGSSKYSARKVLYGLFDTLTTYFIFRFSEKPLHFFGPIGGSILLTGSLLSLYLIYERLFLGILLYRRPALLFALVFIIVGIQIIMTGIVAELIVYLHKKTKKLVEK